MIYGYNYLLRLCVQRNISVICFQTEFSSVHIYLLNMPTYFAYWSGESDIFIYNLMYLLTVCHTIVACALSPIEMNRIQWVLYNAHPCFGIIRASIYCFLGFFCVLLLELFVNYMILIIKTVIWYFYKGWLPI